MIRLTRTGPSPVGQEQAYRIIIDEIPPAIPVDKAEPGTTAAIRLQMRYSVPLFVYGEGLWGKAGPESKGNAEGVGKPQLSWRAVTVQGKPYVELRNTGPVHARLTDVVVQQGSQSKPLADGLLGYVLPGASMRWPAPLTPSAGSVLEGEGKRPEQRGRHPPKPMSLRLNAAHRPWRIRQWLDTVCEVADPPLLPGACPGRPWPGAGRRPAATTHGDVCHRRCHVVPRVAGEPGAQG
ncbi:type 1 pili usher pathway chaperone CsuC [Pseudomonas putida S11]|nr:type 1 pili usher pathway chaperone CsuC [Pseudomonas putida S11]